MDLTVDFIRRYMNEAADLGLLRSFKQDVDTAYIGICEPIRVSEAKIDMRLSSKVKNRINTICGETVEDFGRIGDIAAHKREASQIVQLPYVVQRSAIIELVEADDIV